MILIKKKEELQDQEVSIPKTPPVKTKPRPKTKWGPKKQARVRFCKNCEDTSFISIPDGKCYRCGKEF